VRKRQSPIVGDGGGIWSWIHLDDAAAATVLALEHDGPAPYNIGDDEPRRCASGCRRSPQWTSLLPRLREDFTVYSVDRRGRGRSGDTQPYAIQRDFDDVVALVDAFPNR
jgi:pimeloyl-ACP methyl ester carboxylesterase